MRVMQKSSDNSMQKDFHTAATTKEGHISMTTYLDYKTWMICTQDGCITKETRPSSLVEGRSGGRNRKILFHDFKRL